jgi:hypothetical protein
MSNEKTEQVPDVLIGAATPPPRAVMLEDAGYAERAATPPPRAVMLKPSTPHDEKGKTPPPKAPPQPKKS